ncbi:hypothetical protein AAHA92_02631 [Salvia divinorum]|uniref:Uncharacterized protein n=1 Tax=Salvia divinorum TaxID=28513 RepID=A0ABD1IEJ2_SALDI
MIGSAICLMLTLKLVSQHCLSWKIPKEQKAIVVIVLRDPLYAIDSYVGLIDVKGSSTFFTVLESVKELYDSWKELVHFAQERSTTASKSIQFPSFNGVGNAFHYTLRHWNTFSAPLSEVLRCLHQFWLRRKFGKLWNC